MVAFGQSVYSVPYEVVDNFIENATRYYPGIEWAVSLRDTTIKTPNLAYAVERLRVSSGDIITFDTGMVWDALSFWEALPRFHPCEVSNEVRAKLSPQVKIILGTSSDGNVDQCIDWDLVPQLMTLINECSTVVSYYALPSDNMILYQDTKEKHEPQLSVITTEDGEFRKGCDPRIIFDMDDGFAYAYNHSLEVPMELSSAFEQWKLGGCVTPVLK